MSELRQDPSTRDWVVIAPERGSRPHMVTQEHTRREVGTEPGCPFCPGHEAETPPEVWRLPPDRSEPWRVRVVPNRFPMLAPDGSARRQVSPDGFVRMPGIGRHEVTSSHPTIPRTWRAPTMLPCWQCSRRIARATVHYVRKAPVSF